MNPVNRQDMMLQDYEQVRDASQLMVEAACQGDWDALLAGERRCASIIGRLQAGGDDASLLDRDARKRAHELIRAILANDAKIRELTQPWLRQLETHLGISRMSRRVAAAYHR
jgi:flagellar protein FliT